MRLTDCVTCIYLTIIKLKDWWFDSNSPNLSTTILLSTLQNKSHIIPMHLIVLIIPGMYLSVHLISFRNDKAKFHLNLKPIQLLISMLMPMQINLYLCVRDKPPLEIITDSLNKNRKQILTSLDCCSTAVDISNPNLKYLWPKLNQVSCILPTRASWRKMSLIWAKLEWKVDKCSPITSITKR